MFKKLDAERAARPYQLASAVRITLAFLICPALPVLVTGALHLSGLPAIFDKSLDWDLDRWVKGSLALSCICAIPTIVLGLPMYLLLRRWGALGFGQFIFWGGLIAFVLSLPVIVFVIFPLGMAVVKSTTLWHALVEIPPIRVGRWTI